MTKRLLAIKSMRKVSLGLSSTTETSPPNLHFTRMPNYVTYTSLLSKYRQIRVPYQARDKTQALKACNLRQILTPSLGLYHFQVVPTQGPGGGRVLKKKVRALGFIIRRSHPVPFPSDFSLSLRFRQRGTNH